MVSQVAVIQGYRERWVLVPVVGIDIIPLCFSLVQSHIAIDREEASQTAKTVNLYQDKPSKFGTVYRFIESITIRLPAQCNIVNYTGKGTDKAEPSY